MNNNKISDIIKGIVKTIKDRVINLLQPKKKLPEAEAIQIQGTEKIEEQPGINVGENSLEENQRENLSQILVQQVANEIGVNKDVSDSEQNKVITQITREEVQKAKELKNSSAEQNKSITDVDDWVLVHRTPYWPENGVIRTSKSAQVLNKYEYNGKEIMIPSRRDTIHFALNGEVTNHSLGNNWNEMPISIIIPFKALSEEQRQQIVGGATVDFYVNGDLELPEGAYVICSDKIEGTRDAGRANVIEVEPNEDGGIKGYANALIAKLGYKVEAIDTFVWKNKEDEQVATGIIEQNWKKIDHMDSQEHYAELVEPWIDYTIEVLKIKLREEKYEDLSLEGLLEQKGLRSLVGSPPENYFSEHSEYIETIYTKLEEIGLPMSEDIKREFKKGTQGQFQNPEEEQKARRECSEDNTRIALEIILKKRILETLKLTRIREEIGPNISDVEEKILSDLSIAEAYRNVIGLRDKPFSELPPKHKQAIQTFIQKYIIKNNGILSYGLLENGIMLAKKNSHMRVVPLSQEEEAKVKDLIVGQDDEMMVPIIQEEITEGTVIEYLQRFEVIKAQVEDRLIARQQVTQISTNELGRQTLEEQKDIGAKLSMEELLASQTKKLDAQSQEQG